MTNHDADAILVVHNRRDEGVDPPSVEFVAGLAASMGEGGAAMFVGEGDVPGVFQVKRCAAAFHLLDIWADVVGVFADPGAAIREGWRLADAEAERRV